MLAEDQYSSSDSDEEAKVKELTKKKSAKSILNMKVKDDQLELNEEQQKIFEVIEEKERNKTKDAEIMKKKRAQTMELFMELDNNNDNFVDRKDLVTCYGMFHQIKAASMVPQYKCKKGHKMKIVVHDQNFKHKDIVKIGFKQTNDDKKDDLFKYN